MKRLIAAVSFAVLAIPALAAENGKPFEQLDLDRALPQIQFPAVERSNVDVRLLPDEHSQAAVGGSTVSEAPIASDAPIFTETTRSPWANDYHFIAPAQ